MHLFDPLDLRISVTLGTIHLLLLANASLVLQRRFPPKSDLYENAILPLVAANNGYLSIVEDSGNLSTRRSTYRSESATRQENGETKQYFIVKTALRNQESTFKVQLCSLTHSRRSNSPRRPSETQTRPHSASYEEGTYRHHFYRSQRPAQTRSQ